MINEIDKPEDTPETCCYCDKPNPTYDRRVSETVIHDGTVASITLLYSFCNEHCADQYEG